MTLLGKRNYDPDGSRPYFGALIALVLCGISFSTCRKGDAAAPPATGPSQHERDLATLPQGGSLQGQLEAEAAARTHDAETPTLEKLEEAVKAANITFNPTRQVMGKNNIALYCGRADASDGLDVTVCEYPTPEQANRGETEANVVMSKLAGHSSRHNKKSVMHLIAPSTVPAADLEAVNKAFDAL